MITYWSSFLSCSFQFEIQNVFFLTSIATVLSNLELPDILIKKIAVTIHISHSRNIRNVVSYIGKTIPSQAWTDPEGSRKLTFPYLMTIGA
jgi:hypothetical protein